MGPRGRKQAIHFEQGPILIEDDDDDNDYQHNPAPYPSHSPVQPPPPPPPPAPYSQPNPHGEVEVIDLDDLNQKEKAENDLFGEIAEVIDLTDDLIIEAERQIPRAPALRTLTCYDIGGGLLVEPGTVLQLKIWEIQRDRGVLLKLHEDFFKAEFLQVESILAPHFGTEGQPLFRGRVYARAKNVGNKFQKKLNEVVLIANVDLTDPRPWREQCLVDVPLGILGRFRELRVTNAGYPKFKYDVEELRQQNLNKKRYVEDFGPLVCRHRFIRFNGQEKMRQKRPHEWAIERVTEDEVSGKQFKISSDKLRKDWRGGRRRGGGYVPDPFSGRSETTGLYPGQTYTAGDTFAGGDGASRGMTMAGAFVKFAVDNWDRAVQSLKANFAPQTTVYHSDVSDLITNKEVGSYVDVLHLSPPCQVWSPAHTVPGKNDTMNEAILFSCGGLLETLKPRMFTLEQTFGILHGRFDPQFSRLMADFVELGFSVRWQVVNLATFGLPQPRKRLIVLGAGPGEILPEFPKPTHCLERRGRYGLKPYVSSRQAIAHLENSDRDFGPDHVYNPLRTPKMPWDPDRLMNTITCGGGYNNHHWDGEREFTIKEFAALQGFPVQHQFVGSKTDKKKQIGNAFPPKVVKVFYEHLIACLDRIDGILHRPKGYPPPGVPVYELEPIDVDEYVPQRRRRGRIERSESPSTLSGSGLSADDPMEID